MINRGAGEFERKRQGRSAIIAQRQKSWIENSDERVRSDQDQDLLFDGAKQIVAAIESNRSRIRCNVFANIAGDYRAVNLQRKRLPVKGDGAVVLGRVVGDRTIANRQSGLRSLKVCGATSVGCIAR